MKLNIMMNMMMIDDDDNEQPPDPQEFEIPESGWDQNCQWTRLSLFTNWDHVM